MSLLCIVIFYSLFSEYSKSILVEESTELSMSNMVHSMALVIFLAYSGKYCFIL